MAQSTSVKIFGLEGCVLDALETSLSPERLAIYVNAAGGDREQAVRLYTWNTAVSAAFYGPLQGLEVALRNAMLGERVGSAGGFFAQRGLRPATLLGMIDRAGAAGSPDHPWGRHTGPEPAP